MHHELVENAEVVGALFRAGEDKRQHLVFVRRVHQDTQQIQQFFSRSHAARENNDAVSDTHKRFKAFFDIRHDDQLVDQWVWRLSGNNRRFGHADEAPFFVALLRMADRGALHWRFHRARTAAGADVQLTQAKLVTYATGVEVLVFVDWVTAPAHHHARCFTHVQRAGVAQNGEHQVSDVGGAFQIEIRETYGVMNLPVNEQNIAQYGEQVGLEWADNAPVDERLFRRINQLKLNAAFATQHVNIEAFETGQQLFTVIGQAAWVQYGQWAVAEQLIQVGAGRAFKHVDFQLRQHIHWAKRANMCNQVDSLRDENRLP